MTSCLRNMDRTYTKMINEDEEARLSEVTLARRLLRRSGLNHDEQRHVLASCGHEYNLDKIRTALRLIYGDANLTNLDSASPQRPLLHPLASRNSEATETRSHLAEGSRSTASTT